MSAFPADFSQDPPDMTPEEEAVQSFVAYAELKLRSGTPLTPEERLKYRRAQAAGLTAPTD
jgi:hypothetical protein